MYKRQLILLLLVVLRRWGGLCRWPWPEPALLDRSGLMPSVLMVLGVVLVSFVKPMAFSRYFVVLLLACSQEAAKKLTQNGPWLQIGNAKAVHG